ncbi:hypothetical protein Avbf_07478 [Armadillidium vulgare]|nr:hypothetical protein Avbf_07478 [Armadillidium vulgare]
MKEVDTKNGEEMKKLENEMSRSAFLLKRAEMKIISLTESNKKKDEEMAMLSGLLDDCFF